MYHTLLRFFTNLPYPLFDSNSFDNFDRPKNLIESVQKAFAKASASKRVNMDLVCILLKNLHTNNNALTSNFLSILKI